MLPILSRPFSTISYVCYTQGARAVLCATAMNEIGKLIWLKSNKAEGSKEGYFL